MEMENRKVRAALLALNRIFGFTPQKAHSLLAHFPDPCVLFSPAEKSLPGIAPSALEQLAPHRLREAEEELQRLEDDGAVFLTLRDPAYPKLLADCPDAPVGLYIRSKDPPETLFARPAVAVVGTRDISQYGRTVCTQLVETLAKSPVKPLIVSGLALGVDIIAHRTALENGLPTLAVMATGLDRIYPFCHGRAADLIAETPGSGLATDYPPGTTPLKINFLRRNRIMAGLSRATILIESRLKGGGMITARVAASYNREVYAVPGRITDLRSQGCNQLIGENLAAAVTDCASLVQDLGFGAAEAPAGKRNLSALLKERYAAALSPEELAMVLKLTAIVREEAEIGIEALSTRCGLSYSDASCLVGFLETEGVLCTDLLKNCAIHPDFV